MLESPKPKLCTVELIMAASRARYPYRQVYSNKSPRGVLFNSKYTPRMHDHPVFWQTIICNQCNADLPSIANLVQISEESARRKHQSTLHWPRATVTQFSNHDYYLSDLSKRQTATPCRCSAAGSARNEFGHDANRIARHVKMRASCMSPLQCRIVCGEFEVRLFPSPKQKWARSEGHYCYH
jgi:hypothetical protein